MGVKKTNVRRVVAMVGTSIAWREQVMRGIAGFAHEQAKWHVYMAPEGFENSLFFNSTYRWDGVIARVGSVRLAKAVCSLGVPVVNISSLRARGVNLPQVKVDDRKLTLAAARHLLAAGMRRFAYCGSWDLPEDRGEAFAKEIAGHGYQCAFYAQWSQLHGQTTWQKRQRDLARWVAALAKPVGILTWNSDIACQVLEACNLAGVSVPEDVGIIAGDDDELMCELCNPTISALELPTERIGYEAASLLDRLMDGSPPPKQPVLIEPSGIITLRQSTDTSALENRDVHQAVQFIREHATEPITVADVAQQVLVSRRWLERHFRQVLGCSPHDEIRRTRVDRAKKLLLETPWPVAKVAQATGFKSASYMTSVFTRETTLTPAKFRQRFRP